MSLRILGCILIVLFGAQAYPQRQRQRESSVIFIDFNYNKPGEKSLRSLDQISLQDGTIQGRNSYTDSYGNPTAYDSLNDAENQRPSNNINNPTQYVIPGYASGILQPHEVPPNNNNDDQGRRISDDKIYFVDPFSPNKFQQFDNTPSTSLTVPGINNDNNQIPIEIPRPNFDLNETPIDNPTNDPILPPLNDNLPNTPTPSTTLEVPINQDANTRPFLTGLIPPNIPEQNGVEIPRPNFNAHETPIDDSQNALNQGLLPPTSAAPSFNTFSNPNQDETLVINDEPISFAPKPANGLLPPKDPLPGNFDFQSGPSNINDIPSTSNKFTGKFEGTLGGGVTTSAPIQHIPVHIIQDTPKVNKYTGSFGGSTGVLISENPSDRIVVPNQVTKVQPTVSSTINTVSSAPVFTSPVSSNPNKFTGSFGGAAGVLSAGNNAINPTQAVTNIPITQQSNNLAFTSSNNKNAPLTFGGPQGVLTPFDNLQNN